MPINSKGNHQNSMSNKASALFRSSLVHKLYILYAMTAAAAICLSLVAVITARKHVSLTDAFEAATSNAEYLDHIGDLVYAVVLEAHNVTRDPNDATAEINARDLAHIDNHIGSTVSEWQGNANGTHLKGAHKLAFQISEYRNLAAKLARVANQSGEEAARSWIQNHQFTERGVRLHNSIEASRHNAAADAHKFYLRINDGISGTATWLSVLAGFTIVLALIGAVIIGVGVSRPLAIITRITESVATGDSSVEVPYCNRGDEVGGLARSIGIFQRAMASNIELSRKVSEDAETRARRQKELLDEVTRFSGKVKSTLLDLKSISEKMSVASTRLSEAADQASTRTKSATDASSQASHNAQNIAAATETLSVSVNEIGQQVVESNRIAANAVNEASRTGVAVQELDESVGRIGDAVRLIADIAEQTNLLALNATIEAARAGEAGRGFAIVAGEVKALADQTRRATEEIGGQVQGIQQATIKSVSTIHTIKSIINDIDDISSNIAAAVTQQSATTKEIALSAETAARLTEEAVDQAELVGGATKETRLSSSEVRNVAVELDEVAARIRGQVDEFFDRLSA